MQPEYLYFIFIILMIPLLIWVRYMTSFGKRSQRALVPILADLQSKTTAPLFVAMYEDEGNVIFYLDESGFYCYNFSGIILSINKAEITSIEHSSYGFFHIVCGTTRLRFAYLHHATDAKGLFTMTFGPAYRDDAAIALFIKTLQKFNWPNSDVKQTSLMFLPQIKI